MSLAVKKDLKLVKKPKVITPDWFKHDAVMKYLLSKKKSGATNFQMMMDLHMCDVRKRISILRRRLAEINPDWSIKDIWMESETEGKRPYKRYFLIHEA